MGVDLAAVDGSGPHGRITEEDVKAAVREHAAPPARPAAAPAAALPEGVDDKDAWGAIRLQKMSGIRKAIAVNMARSASTIPHVTNFDDADITELERIRKGGLSDYVGTEIKLTMMAFVMKAVAQALKLHPLVNASVDMENEQIIYKQYVNIGVAVDTERGLVVPVVRSSSLALRSGSSARPRVASSMASWRRKFPMCTELANRRMYCLVELSKRSASLSSTARATSRRRAVSSIIVPGASSRASSRRQDLRALGLAGQLGLDQGDLPGNARIELARVHLGQQLRCFRVAVLAVGQAAQATTSVCSCPVLRRSNFSSTRGSPPLSTKATAARTFRRSSHTSSPARARSAPCSASAVL